MIRKILLLALTTGVANKLYRQYRTKQGGLGGSNSASDMNARSDAGTTTL
jgi:hypothetical protein